MFADQIDNQITFAGRVLGLRCVDPATNKAEQCVAITISVDQVHGVAGVIVPGDFVNILVAEPRSAPRSTATAGRRRHLPQRLSGYARRRRGLQPGSSCTRRPRCCSSTRRPCPSPVSDPDRIQHRHAERPGPDHGQHRSHHPRGAGEAAQLDRLGRAGATLYLTLLPHDLHARGRCRRPTLPVACSPVRIRTSSRRTARAASRTTAEPGEQPPPTTIQPSTSTR